jgi:hypothetical protein
MATLDREVTKEIVNRLLTAALDSAKYVAEGDTFKDEIAKQFGVGSRRSVQRGHRRSQPFCTHGPQEPQAGHHH